MRSPDIRNQDGASLVLVLVFISIFGLIIAGLLTEAGASVKYTNTVSSHEAKVYAADAGVSFGIQQLRQNNELCPGDGVGVVSIPNIDVNGRAVSVTCTVTSGSTVGGLGFAAITTAVGANSLVLQNAQPKTMEGSVYVAGGFGVGPGLVVTKGNLWQKAGAFCTAGAAAPAGVTVQDKPPYDYHCTSTVPTPDPPHLPPSTIPSGTNPLTTSVGSCTVFHPGKYTVPPTLNNGDNYFESGVYYFDFVDPDPANDVFNINHAKVYGGQPTAYENNRALKNLDGTIPACAQPGAVPGDTGTSRTGVLFVFGKQSSMYVDTQGEIELFGRVDSADTTATGNMSFVSVPAVGWAGWDPNTLPSTPGLTSPVLNIKDGNQQALTLHGLVYAPNQDVGLTATNGSFAQTLNGIVVSRLTLQSSASANNVAVSTAMNFPNPRHILITATALGTVPGERSVTSSAVVAIGNDAVKTATVESWRTRGPIDPT